MSHEVETMAYNKAEVPWHGLGFPVDDTLSPDEMLRAARIDWTVSKRQMFFKDDDGNDVKVDDQFALVRDSDFRALTTVGSVYRPTQNAIAMEFFSKFCKAGHMKMETAGSLWHGRIVWVLASINQDFSVSIGKKAADDEVKMYLLMMSPHVFARSMVFMTTAVRVVCQNTLNFALRRGLKGTGGVFRHSHITEFNDEVKKKAESALGMAVSQAEELKIITNRLAGKKAKTADVEAFFQKVAEWDPKDENRKSKDEPRIIRKFKSALTFAPGADLASAQGTWWGAVNAVTHVVDHELGKDRDTALEAAWIGRHAETKRRAFDLAIEAAK